MPRRTRRHHSEDETPDVSRKEAYDKLLRTVKLNTSEKQPGAARRTSVYCSIVDCGPLTRSDFTTAERAAVENKDLGRLVDPRDGTLRLFRLTEAGIGDCIEWLAALDCPDRGLIRELVRVQEEVADDDE
jgi:hypothetical protein